MEVLRNVYKYSNYPDKPKNKKIDTCKENCLKEETVTNRNFSHCFNIDSLELKNSYNPNYLRNRENIKFIYSSVLTTRILSRNNSLLNEDRTHEFCSRAFRRASRGSLGYKLFNQNQKNKTFCFKRGTFSMAKINTPPIFNENIGGEIYLKEFGIPNSPHIFKKSDVKRSKSKQKLKFNDSENQQSSSKSTTFSYMKETESSRRRSISSSPVNKDLYLSTVLSVSKIKKKKITK